MLDTSSDLLESIQLYYGRVSQENLDLPVPSAYLVRRHIRHYCPNKLIAGSSGGVNIDFIKSWITGYHSPSKMIESIRGKPAPLWGLYGTLLRGLMDSLLVYLPLFLMGRRPSFPSWLTFIPTSDYYFWSIFLMPVYLFAIWLLLSSLIHLLLRLSGNASSMDLIMNVSGMSDLVVGAFLIVWDWSWIILGLKSDVVLGISHLGFSVWGLVICTIGFRRLLGIRLRIAVLMNVIWILAGLPLSIVFVRPPV